MRRLALTAVGLCLSGAAIWISSQSKSWISHQLNKLGSEFREEPSPRPSPPPISKVVAEGRLVAYPGADVVVGTEIEGLIVAIPVVEKSAVKKGQLIAELRSEELRAELSEAEARIAEYDADLRHFEREIRREQSLLNRGVGAAHLVDGWKHSLESSQARKLAAMGWRDRLRAKLDKTRILAPIDGVVIERHADAGEVVEQGTKLMTIVDLNRLRIETEVDEYDSDRVHLGAQVRITAEGYGEISWKGRVEEIPDMVSSRRLRPEDPGRPIDARVLAVKVAFDERSPLRLGQRVEVAIFGPELAAQTSRAPSLAKKGGAGSLVGTESSE